MAIIGISGRINSGKDTVGIMIQYLDSQKKGYNGTFDDWYLTSDRGLYPTDWQIKKFAGKLKQIASLLTAIPVEDFESQEVKASNLPKEWNVYQEPFKEIPIKLTVREFLQKLGTEAIRNNIHTDAWVNALFADYKYNPPSDKATYTECFPNWIITDTRFPNEAQAIKDKGGTMVRIERNLEPAGYQTLEQRHPSETSLDGWNFDYVINNNGTLEQLLEATKTLLNNIEN